jgi:hypothetical protein
VRFFSIAYPQIITTFAPTLPEQNSMAKKSTLNQDPIQLLLRKKVFTRATPPLAIASALSGSAYANSYESAEAPSQRFSVVTQDQFLSELDPRSHEINNRLLYPDKLIINSEGVTTGITLVARVSVALQQTIATKQCVHLFAKPLKLTARKNGNTNLFTRFKEYWTERNISSALYLLAKSALTTGDGAICFFMSGAKLGYKIWSYRDGDMLIPVYAENGVDMKMFIRRYTSVTEDGMAVDTIDIIDDLNVTRMTKPKGVWVEVAKYAHGFTQNPVAYHREPDVAWGSGQDLIDKIERLLSDLRESNAYFAFGIMFIKGEEVNVLPGKTTQGKVILSTTSDSDAKILEAPNMSEALKFEYDSYMRELKHVTGTVIIDPETLKGGDQSGAYIKNLYNDAIQYAMDARPRWQPVLEKIVSVVKEGLGLEEKKTLEYGQLTVICEPDIYVPMNVAEETRLVNESVVAGTLSQETASEINAFAVPDEKERLSRETEAKAQAEMELSKVNKPKPAEAKPAVAESA